jgi:ketosteroid isomerase-like protein
MLKPEGIIHKLYTSFQIKDWKTMQSCYHEEAAFSDPVFQNLNSKEVKAMWHMLAAAAQDLKVIFGDVKASDKEGSCRWQAWYKFSRTGKPVHNIIEASFEFKDGQILRHTDTFDLWRWSRMALGAPGVLLGWTPIIKNKIRTTARKGLIRFMDEHPQYK